jgi:signal transduction histidine kinase
MRRAVPNLQGLPRFFELTYRRPALAGLCHRRYSRRGRKSVRSVYLSGPQQFRRVFPKQVLLNLLINAIQAMSGVGEGPRELWVSSEKVAEIPGESEEGTLEDKASAEAKWSHVLIAVRDSGPGLDPKGLDRLFDAFYTTKPQGLGMGLAISRSIIEAHGGRLWAGANASRGAVFQFALPIRDEKMP